MQSKHISVDRFSPRISRELAALLSALQLREPNVTPLKSLSDRQWSNLLDFCDLAHLTLPLAQLPTNDFPTWVIERLTRNVADNGKRFELVKTTYREIAKAFSIAGIEHLVIKGFTQCPDYVELPGFRFQSDLDIYCPEKMIQPARTALEEIGYISAEGMSGKGTDHTSPLIRLGSWNWNGNHYDPVMPLSIELHFCLWNEASSFFSIPGIDCFWNRRSTRCLEDICFPCLSNVDQLGYLALHILRNILLRDWVIHHVLELAVFLHVHASDDAFWIAWREIHDASLRSLEAIAFYYARAWFNCSLHWQVEEEIANISTRQRQWLHRFSGSALEVMFHQNKDSIWLHMSLLKSAATKRKLLKRFLLPATISSITTPGMEIQNRRPRLPGKLHPYLQYLGYLALRCSSYSYINLTTVLRGLVWRFSYKQQ